MKTDDKRYLCVGLVCLDIMNVCHDFPEEDSDQRLIDQRWQRGGNASNNSTVLSMLTGGNCDFLGTLSNSPVISFVENDFVSFNVNIDNCVYLDRTDFPTSCVLVNSKNGSRTIVHSNKNWAEPTAEDFKQVDLKRYSWIHFEGRNAFEVKKMMDYVIEWNRQLSESQKIKLSMELEKDKPGLEHIIDKVDYLFIGRMYAERIGYKNMVDAAKGMLPFVKPGATVVCAWAENGACAIHSSHGDLCKSGIFPPENGVIDTLGAGDTFLSGVIYYLRLNHSLEDSITFGCRLAGAKCGVNGWKNMKSICNMYTKRSH